MDHTRGSGNRPRAVFRYSHRDSGGLRNRLYYPTHFVRQLLILPDIQRLTGQRAQSSSPLSPATREVNVLQLWLRRFILLVTSHSFSEILLFEVAPLLLRTSAFDVLYAGTTITSGTCFNPRKYTPRPNGLTFFMPPGCKHLQIITTSQLA